MYKDGNFLGKIVLRDEATFPVNGLVNGAT
jgi:hypothetical protein